LTRGWALELFQLDRPDRGGLSASLRLVCRRTVSTAWTRRLSVGSDGRSSLRKMLRTCDPTVFWLRKSVSRIPRHPPGLHRRRQRPQARRWPAAVHHAHVEHWQVGGRGDRFNLLDNILAAVNAQEHGMSYILDARSG
jgi:hypothetical protein